jgi:hypothetical protein
MRLVPVDLDRRLKAVFRLPPVAAVDALSTICEEVFALVETHLPGVDTAERRTWLTHHRDVWDHPPQA